jgi:hypothetical protein
VARGGWSDLRSSEKMLSAAQAGSGHTRDAPGDRGRSQGLLTGDGLLWTAQYRFYRTREFDRPPWGGSSGPPYLGHRTAVFTPAGPSGVVASLLPFCPSPCIAADEACAAARTRWQTSDATLSAPNSCNGSRQNEPTMDDARGALLPLASGFRLKARKIKCSCGVVSRADG